ncbi:MAG: translation initiation factor IF-2 [Deltaproteobacteria bacterium]|nr:translation initiation factor IF-2 [Deltaproteobacteria bacterium]
MNKIRVYEVARELGLENRELLSRIASLGIQVRNHMSSLEPGDLDRVKRALEKEKQQNIVEERIRPTVVRRRIVGRAKPVKEPEVPITVSEQRLSIVQPKPTEEAVKPAVKAPKTSQTAAKTKAAKEAEAAVKPKQIAKAGERRPAKTAVAEPQPVALAPIASADTQPIEEEREVEGRVEKPKRQPMEQPPVLIALEAESAFVSKDIPTQPPSYEERLGAKALPPGVVARGKQVGLKAAPLTAEERSRIVSEHAEQRRAVESPVTAPPRRRELARAAIGPTGRQQQKVRPGRPGRAKKPAPGKKALKTELTTPSAQKRVIRIEDQIGLQTLAQRMSLKATEVLMKLMQLGMTGVMINSTIDADTAKIVASEFGFEVENVAVSYDEFISEARGKYEDDKEARVARPPIITVMGHVDHGKTSLLDKIRKTNVAAKESGGITQHLGAYRVDTKKGTVVFLDTPGHAAFTAMRTRGAQATDVVILVVAADDGVMPQTKEAINHARAANVPIVVAINKIDKPDARPDVVMRDLANLGLQPEEWGGQTICVKVSAVTGEGIDTLLDNMVLQAEVLELMANPNIPAQGVVLESYVDKGRGPVANLLVRDGMLKTGSFIVAGGAFGKIRAMTDDRGKQISKAGPATPVEVLGLSEIPDAGDTFDVVTDAKVAQQVAERRKAAVGKSAVGTTSRIALDQLLNKMRESELKELNLVIKSDVQGSSEALAKALSDISSTKVKVNIIHSGVGGITESDIMLASASNAIVIGFRVRPTGGAIKVSKSERVEIRTYNVIYEAIDDVAVAMTGLLKPELIEKAVGRAEVRQVFNLAKGKIAGCFVADGKIIRSGKVRLVRDSVQVWEGTIKSLKRVREDVREVASGLECGVGLENFHDIKENDIIECFEVEEIAVSL